MNNEKWIDYFDGVYRVSNLGNVARIVPGKGAIANKVLKQPVDSAGYCVTTFCVDGKRYPRRTHTVVAELFLGPRPGLMEINHIDGDKKNNMACNLEYISKSNNAKHARALGLIGPLRGKLSNDSVIQIRQMAKDGVSQGVIAKLFDKQQSNISEIVNYKIWRNIK